MLKARCNRLIFCYDYQKRPCLRPKGHDLGCNPFSSGDRIETDNSMVHPKQVTPIQDENELEMAS
jgi:hypothetical protein